MFLVIELLAWGFTARERIGIAQDDCGHRPGARPALVQPATFVPGVMLVALVTHFVLAILFTVIRAEIMALFSLDSSVGMASQVGAVFGLLLYLVNFHGRTQWFPWFADARGWLSFLDHVVFGLVAADTCLRPKKKERGAFARYLADHAATLSVNTLRAPLLPSTPALPVTLLS
ncbi:hypothetical protein [Burkholderia thailandensis]|uniref:hypothetical protein n=1 Tax=Burkholderia thailandensis TaxID=57975 RepID=UPI0030805EC7